MSSPANPASPKKVVVIGGGPSGKHAAERIIKLRGTKVTMITANRFVEWAPAMPKVLVRPELHYKALSTQPELFQLPEASYRYGRVIDIVFKNNRNEVILDDGSRVRYDALVVASGFGLPIFYPKPKHTVEERKEEVLKVSQALRNAECIAIVGGGLVALEFAGEIRLAYPNMRIVLVVRRRILSKYSEKIRRSAEEVLQQKSIEVVAGDTQELPRDASLEPGEIEVGSTKISYSIYIPAYSRGPNTTFVDARIMDDDSRIKVNSFLQSTMYPEVFSVGVNDLDVGFSGLLKMRSQWDTVAHNVKAFLEGGRMQKFKDEYPTMRQPPLVVIGRGTKGWAVCDFQNLPAWLRCCCCCGLGGFPVCPLPLFWPCLHPMVCGFCMGPPSGCGPAWAASGWEFNLATRYFEGMSSCPPKQQNMV